MYVCVTYEWSCACVLDMSGLVCACSDMGGHVCVC
jgi:hypothetical protein